MRHLGARLALTLTLVVAGVMVGTPVVAQEVIEVSARDLMAHRLESKSPLVYPAIAKAARISGTVVVQLDVSAEGAVVSTKAISGHPMLQQAAIDFVKQWTFKPFEKDGVAVDARGQTSVIFTLGESVVGSGARTDAGTATQTPEVRAGGVPVDAAEEATAKTYFEQFTTCSAAIRANKHDAETALICRHAADTAATFAPDRRFIEKRAADVYAATALANSGDLVGALRYADRAVDVVKLGHDDNSGSSAAYATRGSVEALLNNWSAADADLTIGEDFERKGLAWAEKEKIPAMKAEYRRVLAKDLRTHAAILQRMNRMADAQAKLNEAAQY